MTGEAGNTEDKRRRGVQASRTRLQHALAESGLKTQTAVAERIAEQESLDTAPRGLVNKVFRGESVDPRSIERVARALAVEAWTLYLTSDEPAYSAPADDPDAENESPEPPSQSRPTVRRVASYIGPLAMVVLLALFLMNRMSDRPESPHPRSPQATVAILPLEGPHGERVQRELSRALNRTWRVVPGSSPGIDPQRVLNDNSIDHVVAGRLIENGRWLAVALDLHSRNSMQTLWRGEWRIAAAGTTVARRLEYAVAALLSEDTGPVRSRDVQSDYLDGRAALDEVRTELNVRRALTAFERAIRADRNLADGYAGLCEALIQDHVRTGDAKILDDADLQCAQAIRLDPGSVEARRSQAYLLRKRGSLAEARALFEDVLTEEPNNTDAWIELAEVHLTRYARQEDPRAAEQALDALDRASDIESGFWKVPFTRARVLYFAGRLDEAVLAASEAASLDANVLALSNLGSFRYCQGDFSGALEAYQNAKTADSLSFVGEGQIAVVHYYLRDFAQSVRSFETALALHEHAGRAEDHRLWGNYAHARRQNGQTDAATLAYGTAIRLAVEADKAGDGSPVHGAYLAFYREMVYLMTGDESYEPLSSDRLSALAGIEDPISQLYLSIIFALRGDGEQARELKAKGAEGCPGFARSPDFEIASFGR